MAWLVDLSTKERQRRRKLSKFALCVDDAVVFKDHAPLVKMLRSDYQLTAADQNLLASYLEKLKIKRGSGRPKGKPLIRLDWLGRAALDAEALLAAWKRLSGGRRKVKMSNGSRENIRIAVCERMAKKYGHPNGAGKLERYLDRSRSRR